MTRSHHTNIRETLRRYNPPSAMRAWVLAGALAASCAIAPTAVAEPADVLYKEGAAAAEAGQLDVAFEKLKAAWALRQTYEIAANLAAVENALGKHRDAAEHFQFALENFPSIGEQGARAQLQSGLDAARKKVGELKISVAAGATVEVNGRVVGIAPLKSPVFVEPGQATISCKKPDFGEGKALVEVRVGEAQDVRVEIRVTTGDPPAGEKPIWPAIVLGIVGAGGIGAGIGLTVVGVQKNGEAEDLAAGCPGLPSECVTAGDELIDDGNTFLAIGGVGFGIGAAALIGVLVYQLVPASSQEAVSFTPLISPNELSGSATFRF